MSLTRTARPHPEAAVVKIGQALAHPLRVRVLNLLVEGEPFRAGALARRLHVALPLMKQHLMRLQTAQLISTERIDNAVYYRIAGDGAIGSVRPLLALGQSVAPAAADTTA
jgi:DNA-binding transcriptional ArsR family regulator